MEKLFAIVDGQLYINETLVGESTVGMVRVTDERVNASAVSISMLFAQIASECAARAAADSALALRLDDLQRTIRPGL